MCSFLKKALLHDPAFPPLSPLEQCCSVSQYHQSWGLRTAQAAFPLNPTHVQVPWEHCGTVTGIPLKVSLYKAGRRSWRGFGGGTACAEEVLPVQNSARRGRFDYDGQCWAPASPAAIPLAFNFITLQPNSRLLLRVGERVQVQDKGVTNSSVRLFWQGDTLLLYPPCRAQHKKKNYLIFKS